MPGWISSLGQGGAVLSSTRPGLPRRRGENGRFLPWVKTAEPAIEFSPQYLIWCDISAGPIWEWDCPEGW
jgi:hypothetical protein